MRDAQGNSLAVYDNTGNTNNWWEQQLYGSRRLGMWKPNLNLATANGSSIWNSYGLKFFELNNHLGNVMAVVSDNRTQTGSTYEPDVINSNDYYAFGGQMNGRDFTNPGAQAYRYGFNGKENDNEVKGAGNQQDYGMRIYDPRIGKFLSVDPITAEYPMLTPYQFASNRPIGAIDLDGLEAKDLMTGKVILFPKDEKLKKLKSNDYSYWSDMLDFEKSSRSQTAFGMNPDIKRQEMKDASGKMMNTDYYDVTITKLPPGMTKTQLFDHIKRNFDEFMDLKIANFVGTNTNSAQRWIRGQVFGTTMTFVNPIDQAGVVASQSSKDNWVFTPAWTPEDLGHPLAGHRQFGLTDNGNSTFTFYTRGVDRMWSELDTWYNGNEINSGRGRFFDQAGQLWNKVMDNVAGFVNEHGGEAKKTHSFSRRINWREDVKKEDKK